MVACPICGRSVKESNINAHIDSACRGFLDGGFSSTASSGHGPSPKSEIVTSINQCQTSAFFRPSSSFNSEASAKKNSEDQKGLNIYGSPQVRTPKPALRRQDRHQEPSIAAKSSSHDSSIPQGSASKDQSLSISASPSNSSISIDQIPPAQQTKQARTTADDVYEFNKSNGHGNSNGLKRDNLETNGSGEAAGTSDSNYHRTETMSVQGLSASKQDKEAEPMAKRMKMNGLQRAQPLAERMRPRNLDEVVGQDLVGPSGVLRGLIESDRVPSMILWGGAGTGKTTIARVVAHVSGARFAEINSTSSGVADCKKLFNEARSELGLTGRKTIIFCDEIHRFSKTQQDVFLGPVEAGVVTLIGATTENPSFKVQSALLSRCRVFVLAKLDTAAVIRILERALHRVREVYQPGPLLDDEMIAYLATFADGDARTSLNLLELAMDLSRRPDMSRDLIKASLTKTLVYDRAGDQHYDTISAFHKSVRGSDPDATLYYLARMLQSGEDALYIARRMVVIASEDIGLADNSMLSLATATYTAAEKVGLPEARINLAHCAVSLALAPKSTRSYRALSRAFDVLKTPGIASLPIPVHLRNAPTRLMKEMGYGKEYKYNPNYANGKVKQDYFPAELIGSCFLQDEDLGHQIDSDLDQCDGPQS